MPGAALRTPGSDLMFAGRVDRSNDASERLRAVRERLNASLLRSNIPSGLLPAPFLLPARHGTQRVPCRTVSELQVIQRLLSVEQPRALRAS
jgi:hypothetical protein